MEISLNRAEFAQKLKALREQNNLTIRQAAEQLGIAESTLYGYEDATRLPNAEIILKLVVCYDVDPLYLLGLYDFPYSISQGLTEDSVLVKKYNSLPEYCRRYVDETIDDIYERNCKGITDLKKEDE